MKYAIVFVLTNMFKCVFVGYRCIYAEIRSYFVGSKHLGVRAIHNEIMPNKTSSSSSFVVKWPVGQKRSKIARQKSKQLSI